MMVMRRHSSAIRKDECRCTTYHNKVIQCSADYQNNYHSTPHEKFGLLPIVSSNSPPETTSL